MNFNNKRISKSEENFYEATGISETIIAKRLRKYSLKASAKTRLYFVSKSR